MGTEGGTKPRAVASMTAVVAIVSVLVCAWAPATLPASEPPPVNPHGDVVFRATGTASCTACHG